MAKVVVVGQTPPPYHGQSIMTQKMLDGDYGGDVVLHHVRMAFSKEIDEVGKLSVGLVARKVAELARVIGKIIKVRFSTGADILWYPPAGPERIPMLRDLAILLTTRWFFCKTIFHFHAGGLSELYDELSAPLRLLFRAAYFRPDAAIRISELAPEDGKKLEARREFIVPNGIEDQYPSYADGRSIPNIKVASGKKERPPSILFVGKLSRSKGVMTLLRACKQLSEEEDLSFVARLIGQFESAAFEEEVHSYVRRHGLEERVKFLGVLSGREKWSAFAAADVFCFPSYFESETFGLVLVEAFSFSLPVVTTQWRGIPSVVGEDGECGFLVPPRNPSAVADRLARLLLNPALRRAMGARGRQRYLEQFTIETFRECMATVFREVAAPASDQRSQP